MYSIIVSGLPPCFHVAILVRKTHDAVAVGDIDPLRVIARRIKGDAIGLVQIRSEDVLLLDLGALDPVHANLIRLAVRNEEIAIGCCANDARILQS